MKSSLSKYELLQLCFIHFYRPQSRWIFILKVVPKNPFSIANPSANVEAKGLFKATTFFDGLGGHTQKDKTATYLMTKSLMPRENPSTAFMKLRFQPTSFSILFCGKRVNFTICTTMFFSAVCFVLWLDVFWEFVYNLLLFWVYSILFVSIWQGRNFSVIWLHCLLSSHISASNHCLEIKDFVRLNPCRVKG